MTHLLATTFVPLAVRERFTVTHVPVALASEIVTVPLLAGVISHRWEPAVEPWGFIEMLIEDLDGIRIVMVEVPSDHPLRRDPRSSSAPRRRSLCGKRALSSLGGRHGRAAYGVRVPIRLLAAQVG